MDTNRRSTTVIGLLYPGEMGAALGRLLRSDGLRVVTTLQDRSPRTQTLSRDTGLEELGSLAAVVRTADVLLSLVPPTAAVAVACQCRELLAEQPARSTRRIYVDLNSISPVTAGQIAEVLAAAPVDFVNGAISGSAAYLTSRGVVYLSGPRAARVAELLPKAVAVQVLGDVPGQASAMRMLLSGLAKGVVALFVEMALAARQADILEPLLTAYQTSYPGILEVVERSLPTFPRHAVRRGQEMAEVETTLTHLGLCPAITASIREVIAAMGNLWQGKDENRNWSVIDVINDLHRRQLLQQPRAEM
jgi:3-hydroxyisobutyrate dehydrogenase-like beta-hydroxyacid dehydrogenase